MWLFDMNDRCNNNTNMKATRVNGWLYALLITALSYSLPSSAEAVPLESWVNPFTIDSSRRSMNYQWEIKPAMQHRICAFIPSSETSYWFAVNYGLVKQARKLGVSLKVFHVSKQSNDNTEQLQKIIAKCADHNPQGLIVDADFAQVLHNHATPFAKDIHIIAVGKNLLAENIDASSSASFTDIGSQLAKYMNQHQADEQVRQMAMFPGDRNMQYVSAFVDGFIPQINGNKFHLRDTVYTSNNYLDIKNAMTRYLNSNLDTSIIIGSAKVTQAAVEVLNEMSLTDDIEIISYELSAQTYRDIKRGKIAAAITNPPVVQGFLAVDMALKLIENRLKDSHVSPQSTLIDAENLPQFDIRQTFAPYGYRETLEVN